MHEPSDECMNPVMNAVTLLHYYAKITHLYGYMHDDVITYGYNTHV